MKIGIAAIAATGLLIASIALFNGSSDGKGSHTPLLVTSEYRGQPVEEHTSAPPNEIRESVQTPDIALVESVRYGQGATDLSENIAPSPPSEEIEMEMEILNDVAMLNPEGGFTDALETLQDSFENDSEDGLHSFEAEGNLLNMVANSGRLSAYALAETSCKLSNCKVTFFVTDEEQHSQLTNDLLLTLQEKEEHLNIMVEPFDNEGVAHFYLGVTDDNNENL